MNLYKSLAMNGVLLKEMPFTMELAMEAFLCDNEAILSFGDDGFQIIAHEQELKNVRINKNGSMGDGRIDLLGIYGENTIAVIELKKKSTGTDALNQLSDYLSDDARKKILDCIDGNIKKDNVNWCGILVGNEIEEEIQNKIKNNYMINGDCPLSAVAIKRYMSPDGQFFVVADGYESPGLKTDKTKYIFDGIIYSKRRCVLAVVTKYCQDNSDETFADVQAIFKKGIQGSLGIVETVDSIETKAAGSKNPERYLKRFFMKPGEIIKLQDTNIAVCGEWTKDTMEKFIEHVNKKLGYEIKEAL